MRIFLDVQPAPFPKYSCELEKLNNKKVILKGRFDHQNEVFLEAKNLNPSAKSIAFKGGYHVLTPLILSDSGHRILVNRGWISTSRKDPSRRSLGQIEDEVQFNAFYFKEAPTSIKDYFNIVKGKASPADTVVELDLEKLKRIMKIEPIGIFVADSESTLLNGPLGGQIDVNNYDTKNMFKPL